MSYYYKRPMGNGTMAAKFRLGSITQMESSERTGGLSAASEQKAPIFDGTNDASAPQDRPSHFPNSCNRCYRLKKKCSREYPVCSHCLRLGSDCEYENKRAKRRKADKTNEINDEETKTTNNTNDDTSNDTYTYKKNGSSLTGSSITMRNSTLMSASPSPGQSISHGSRHLSHRALLAKRSALRALKPPTPMNLREEYITMDSVPEDKAYTFANSFFTNYGTKYPFISQTRFFSWFGRINFDQEAIVNLDGYLVMAIGLLIHDLNTKSTTFASYFSEKIIESIVDIIDFDMSQSLDLENVRLLLLLGIYSLHSFLADLCWSIVGALDRIALQLDLYCTKDPLKLRLFWSIYNIDKELSILRNKPSQIPSDRYISLPFPLTDPLHGQPENNLDVVNQEIAYYKLVDQVLMHKLAVSPPSSLQQLSSDLEKWRIATSRTIHTRYCDNPMLQHYVSQVNMKYYYLCVEMDQVSDSQLSQFTLQFLLNSFTLLISENNKSCGLSLHNLFWYQLLFRVIRCTLVSVEKILGAGPAEFAEFNNNLQLAVNIVKFLSRQNSPYSKKVDRFLEKLTEFSMLLLRHDAESTHQQTLLDTQREVLALVDRLL